MKYKDCTIIIPAAGLGKRVGMQPHESKELLPDSSGKPLINYAIGLSEDLGINPTIITRKEKTTLIDYVQSKLCNVLIIEPEGEWPNTILKSKELWSARNILLLPDTRFSPERIVKHMFDSLNYNELSFGVHQVEDISKWGCVEKIDRKSVDVCEKPNKTGPGLAWGIIGWQKDAGEDLFSLYTEKNTWKIFNNSVCFNLNKFEDVTR